MDELLDSIKDEMNSLFFDESFKASNIGLGDNPYSYLIENASNTRKKLMSVYGDYDKWTTLFKGFTDVNDGMKKTFGSSQFVRQKDSVKKKGMQTILQAEGGMLYNGNYYSLPVRKALNEYFDITDEQTRKTLISLDEEGQNQVLTALTNKLYNDIVERVDNVDFGDIPNTKGDITKLPNYKKLSDCINTIESIVKEYKQPVDVVNIAKQAKINLEARKDLWEKAYRYESDLIIMTYETMSLALISSVSYLISTCIEFIKNPGTNEFTVVFDKVGYSRAKDSLLFENLKRFNAVCTTGDLDKAFDTILRNHMKNFTGMEIGAVAAGLAVIAIVLNIIPILRELVFFFYYSRTRVSEYFDIQADLLQMNAQNLQMQDATKTGKTGVEKERVIKRQMQVVNMFHKIADFFRVNVKNSESKAKTDIEVTNKKIKTSDIMDTVPDSTAQSLF